MKHIEVLGVEINRVKITDLLFNKTMLIAYLLLSFGLYGCYEVILERYFFLTANAFDAGLAPGSREVAYAMKEAIFGLGGEVNRESPWTMYISNYMYMIYSGSGIIFFVALAEILNIKIIQKTAAGFMTIGLAMIFGGLFTIVMDLNILHIRYMFLTPNLKAGMWLMLPLYSIYIPFVMFEIYLLITKNQKWAKKMAFGILLLSIAIDITEYYIQAKLFDMNAARHLWTTYPNLTLYFIVSSFVASLGIMLIYSFIEYKDSLKQEFNSLILLLTKSALICIILLAGYEATAFLFIDQKWGSLILFGDFKYDFYIYVLLAIVFPFGLLLFTLFKRNLINIITILASFCIIVGTYIGRLIFVYGGNAYPMSDRFGTGFEKYREYELVKEFIYFSLSLNEVFIIVGSVGVVLLVYKVLDSFFSVSKIREH